MQIIGYLAAFLTLIAYLPQTLKLIRTRETKDISLLTFLIVGLSAVLWVVYGIMNNIPAIWVTNSVVSACTIIIVVLKLRSN